MGKHFKHFTEHKAIENIPAPAELIIPMVQHIGAPATPTVKVGDKVFVGTLIGDSDAFVSAKVHSSVSGEVIEITEILYPFAAKMVAAIKIKNDYNYTVAKEIKAYPDIADMEPNEIVEAVKNGGLVGMGGATFPTSVKLSPPPDKNIDTIILNAAECEPYLTSDHRVLLEETEHVLYGLQAVKKAVGADQIIIGIENNKMDGVEALKNSGAENISTIKVLPSKYPTGAEKILVKKTIKRRVPLKGIPLDVGVLVINVSTAAQISKTLKTGLPLIDRITTIAGDGFANPGNYRSRIGTLISEIAEPTVTEAESSKYSLVLGGPMMGYAVSTLELPIIKGISGVLLLKKKATEESPCIRCGNCITHCSLKLIPYEKMSLSCMECGVCSYYCPANRKLSQKAKLLKLEKAKERK